MATKLIHKIRLAFVFNSILPKNFFYEYDFFY